MTSPTVAAAARTSTAGQHRVAARVVLAAVLGLTACMTVGPDFEEPSVTWLADWQSDLYAQVGNPQQQTESDLRFWWYLFDDPVLNDLIETAKRANPSLQIAGLRILESRAALGIARSNYYPQLQQLSGAATYVDTQRHGGQVIDRYQSFAAYQAAWDTGWELDFWGRFRRGVESANATFLASITAYQDVQVLLGAQVADLYFAYRTTLLRIAIARNNSAIQKRSFEITEKIFESGQGSELDLQQAKTQYLATLATIPDLEATLVSIRNSLGALLGRAPGDLPELAPVEAPLPTIAPLAIRDIPVRLLMRRPDIRTAAWLVAAQSAQIGIAKADYYPAITLLGSINWSFDTLSGSPATSSLAVGPALTWNLFDYGRIRNNVRLQDARLQQAIESFQNDVLQAAREMDDAAIRVVKTAEQQVILEDALRAAERSLTLANIRFQEGYADFQRVLDAQQVLFARSERELVNQGEHISAIIGLYKAIGGGWLDTPMEQVIPASTRDAMRERTHWGDLLTDPLPPDAGAPPDSSEVSP